MGSRKELVRFYRTSEDYLNFLKSHQESHLKSYIPFIERYVPKGARVLKLGIGPGLAALFLSQRGYEVVGIDISIRFLKEISAHTGPHFRIVGGARD